MTDNLMLPPHNLDAEQAVLGGMMIDGGEERSQKVLAMLKPESFYHKTHGALFDVMRELLKRSQPIDLLTVSDEMERRGALEQLSTIWTSTQPGRSAISVPKKAARTRRVDSKNG